MFNLIKAEMYKSFRRLYSKVFLAVTGGGLILLNILLSVVNRNFGGTAYTRSEMMLVYMVCLVVGMYLAIVTTDLVFSDEYKHGTLKNTVAFGYTRTEIYFSKLISSCIVTVLMALFLVIIAVVTGWVLFESSGSDMDNLVLFLKYALAVTPLWLSQVAFSIAVWANVKSSNFGAVFVTMFTAMAPGVLQLVTMITEKPIFNDIAQILPISQFNKYQSLTDFSEIGTLFPRFAVIGFSFFAGFMLLGWLGFYRREIK